MDPSIYHPLLPLPPPLLARSMADNAYLEETTIRLNHLVDIFQNPSRREDLEDTRLLKFQQALLEGLSVFARSGLLVCSMDIDPDINGRELILRHLQETLTYYYPATLGAMYTQGPGLSTST